MSVINLKHSYLLLISAILTLCPGAESRDLVLIAGAKRKMVREIEATGAWVNYVNKMGVVAEATKTQQELLQQLGYPVEIITPDISAIYERNFQESCYLGQYLTYNQFCDTMVTIALNNHHICKLETLGLSYNDNQILGMKISDNPETHENEPIVYFEGNIHGDEKIAWAITFELIKYLVQHYSTDTLVNRLVNSREIWLVPMVNPDGYINSSRYNGHSVDLNRNWGWMWGNEPSQGTAPFSEPESQALLNHIWRNPAVTYVSYHAGTVFISYPWSYCYSYQNTIPELNLIRFLSARYDAYTHYTYGQGSDSMYLINGSTKDFDYGYGMMGWSIEVHLQKTPPASQIDPTFSLNLPAMLALIHHAGQGISGVVTDAITGEPVHCQIWVSPANWLSYNHPQLGDFHRFYLPGTYTLTFRAPGYQDTTISNVVVPDYDDSAVTINVQMIPDSLSTIFAFRHIYNNYVNINNNRTYPVYALGHPDGNGFRLDNSKYICLDMGKPVYNQKGPDFVVYRSAGTGSAQIQVANNWQGTWINIGTASAPETEFDLNSIGLDSIRYVRATANGEFHLDAIKGVGNNLGVSAPNKNNIATPSLFVQPNPARERIKFTLPVIKPGDNLLTILTPTGRVVKTLALTGSELFWDGKDAAGVPVAAGLYFACTRTIAPVRFLILK